MDGEYIRETVVRYEMQTTFVLDNGKGRQKYEAKDINKGLERGA